MGSNSSNAGKNRTRAYSRKKSRVGKKKIFFFIQAAIDDARHLCVDIGDGLRIP